MKLQRLQNEQELIAAGLKILTDLCAEKEGIINIALSGGTTPKNFYKALARTDLPFDHIEFFQLDERYVPPDHTDSNQKMIRAMLPHQKIHFFDTSLSIEDSLKAYVKKLPQKFDLCILGMGTDGHIASLFPHDPALETTSPVAHTSTTEFAIKDRLTLTFKPILSSKKLLLLLKGATKEPLLQKLAHEADSQNFPAAKLINHPDFHVLFTQ